MFIIINYLYNTFGESNRIYYLANKYKLYLFSIFNNTLLKSQLYRMPLYSLKIL